MSLSVAAKPPRGNTLSLSTATAVGQITGLLPVRPSPDSPMRCPPNRGQAKWDRKWSVHLADRRGRWSLGLEGVHMTLIKRLGVALGSLLALALAGGAHWRW